MTDLTYEFADANLKWDADRDLKEREPLFTSGSLVEEDPATLKEGVKKGIG